MEFVAVTALRREAVLSLEWCNVNTQERYVAVQEWQDKKKRRRFKPLTDSLVAKLQELTPKSINFCNFVNPSAPSTLRLQ